jgi:hypothetical protein
MTRGHKSPPEFWPFHELIFHTPSLLRSDTFCCTRVLSKDTDNGTPQGSCVDNEDFVDAQGYSCTGHKDFNCLAEETFTHWGYLRAEWQDVVQNCPASCRLCPGKMSMHGISAVLGFAQFLSVFLFCNFTSQSPRRKLRLRACVKTPRGMWTVKDSIAAATPDTIV